ncbi:hypothetical protein K525DRAFT_199784 [Schizophyllum commune Loenen D]|nr:hypothetical protein K525DRAFT_199784 [Schizophyllum commune Loenen D]
MKTRSGLTLRKTIDAPRKRSGIKRQRQARAATHREELLRRSSRLASRQVLPNYKEGSSSTFSVPSAPDLNYALPKAPKRVFRPFREERIGWITPTKRITYKDPRPKAKKIHEVAPTGDKCPLTGRSQASKVNQNAHLVEASTKDDDVEKMEESFGVVEGSLNLHTRLNLVPLSADMHISMDASLMIIIPVLSDLQKLYDALDSKTVKDWDDKVPLKKNRAGFIHHEQGRDFHAVPLLNWGDGPIPFVKRYENGGSRTGAYGPPFFRRGKPILPLMKLHCSPYFAVWRAYKTLEEVGLAKAPKYMTEEAKLVVKIGKLLTLVERPKVRR